MMFRSLHDALAWAFETSSRPIVEISNEIADLRQNHACRASGQLSIHDLHAQAAMILMRVNHLPVDQRCVIYGMYQPALRKTHALALAGMIGSEHSKLEADCAESFLGNRRLTIREIAKINAVSKRAADTARRGMFEKLNALHYRATDALMYQLHDLIANAA